MNDIDARGSSAHEMVTLEPDAEQVFVVIVAGYQNRQEIGSVIVGPNADAAIMVTSTGEARVAIAGMTYYLDGRGAFAVSVRVTDGPHDVVIKNRSHFSCDFHLNVAGALGTTAVIRDAVPA